MICDLILAIQNVCFICAARFVRCHVENAWHTVFMALKIIGRKTN